MTDAIPRGCPLHRDDGPFNPPTEMGRRRDARPLSRMIFPDGHDGYLATGYHVSRQLLADHAFSSRMDTGPVHMPMAIPGHETTDAIPTEPGSFINMDPPDHTRYRRMLTGAFTVRRMRQWERYVTEVVEHRLTEFAALPRPADLVAGFAMPVPSLVICELLGVPYSERETFQTNTAATMSLDVSMDERLAAHNATGMYLYDLVRRKRSDPGDDLLSDLIATGELTDAELTGMSVLLLAAGHETTANMLALGTFALLENPDQWAALRDDPALIPGAVEELLRYLSIADLGIRTSTGDLQLGDETIPEGVTVAVSIATANRDPNKFPDPDTLDVTRDARGHLAFGHGIHQCLGQQLARIEMRIGFEALIRRFPDLRLAVPAEDVPLRTNMQIYGVHELPVTWG